jgi:hypothetical protein
MPDLSRLRAGAPRPASALPVDELRLVLALWPLLTRRIDALAMASRPGRRKRPAPVPDQLRWSGLYELPLARHLAAAAVAFDMDRELIGAARQAIPVASLAELTAVYVKQDPHDAGSTASTATAKAGEAWMQAGYLRSIRESLRALLVYGRSINDLVAAARDGGDDRALFDAIRVDPVVLNGTTGATRLARALLEEDAAAVRAIRAAVAMGLTARQIDRERAAIAAIDAITSVDWQPLRDASLLALFRRLRREAAAGSPGSARTASKLARLAAEMSARSRDRGADPSP